MSLRDKPLKHLNIIAERPTLNVEFQDLKYSVKDSNFKEGWRQILHSINGKFFCGELTAILGPSGAGKTTLLNILAGYVANIEGTVKINDFLRDTTVFKKMLSYIMQDDIIQPFLTVKEAMVYAAHFKMGANVKVADRIAVIEEVVDFLGLEKCVNTYSQYLSGGERKRLNIALELINNPPVIFLDEPTTGLDDFAVRQCVDLLKKISKLDRTVVCTIHQPQASLFQVFDRVYIIADGYCVYNGSPAQMVPFFSLASYTCPSNNTPAEYMIELVHSDPSIINCFKDLIQNGKISMNETVDSDTILETFNNEVVIQNNDTDFPTSFYVQLFYLMSRRFLQMKRNRIGLYIQFFNHLLLGFAIAGLYGATGNNAKHTFTIFKYCICCNVFLMFTYMMTPVLLFPLELVLLKREHFNRWYSLKAFYSALFFSSLPLFITLGSMFIGIVYFLTDQPKEVDRFLGFYLTCFAIALTAQGLGYLVGSVCRITSGSIIVSLVMAPLVLLSYYGIDNGSNIQSFYRFLMTLSFMRHGVIGLCNALFYQRKPLTCYDDEVYCHYARPDVLMRDMSMPLTDYKYQLGHIFIFMVIFHIMGYLSLKCRLNVELFCKIDYYTKKMFKFR